MMIKKYNFRPVSTSILATSLLSTVLFGDTGRVFLNFDGSAVCQVKSVETPSSTDEVVTVVKSAIRSGLSIKATAKSPQTANTSICAGTGGVQISTEKLNRILEVNTPELWVRVQTGIKYLDFNRSLHQDHKLVLPSVSEFGEVTLGGMLGAGVHGSGMELSSSIQDWLLSATIVDGKGEVRTISAGPLLDAVKTNLGVLGIVTEVTLKILPSFKVSSLTESFTDDSLEQNIEAFARRGHWSSVQWFPGQKKYAVQTFTKVSETTPGTARNAMPEFGWIVRSVFPRLFTAMDNNQSHSQACNLESKRFDQKLKNPFVDDRGRTDNGMVGWVHEMTSWQCRDRCAVYDIPFQMQEIAIPFDVVKDFIADARQMFQARSACIPLNGIYFRFGKSGTAAVSPSAGRESVYVDIEFVKGKQGFDQTLDFDLYQELTSTLLKKYSGRPHLGKNLPSAFKDFGPAMFPRWSEFAAAKAELDPDGVFSNSFTRSFAGFGGHGFNDAGCAATGSCYCSNDSECSAGKRCVTSLVGHEVRVCRKP